MTTLAAQARALDAPAPSPSDPGRVVVAADGARAEVSPAELELARRQARREFLAGLRRIDARIAGGRAGHEYLAELRSEQYVVSRVSAVLGGVSFPPLTIWDPPEARARRAREELAGPRLGPPAEGIEHAERESAAAAARVTEYREGTITGAGRAVTGLEVTRDVSFATAGILATLATGGLAGAAIGAGISAAGTVAQQVTELQLGMRRQVDWSGIAFDAVVGLVTGAIGGKLGNAVAARALANPAVASLGRRVVTEMVSNLLAGRASTILHGAARALFDNVRGAPDAPTPEQFLDQLAEQLTDPRAAFMDVLMGEIGRRSARRAPPARTGSRPAGQADGEPPRPPAPRAEPERPPAPPPAPEAPRTPQAAAPPPPPAAPALPEPAPAPRPRRRPRQDPDLRDLARQERAYEQEARRQERAERGGRRAREETVRERSRREPTPAEVSADAARRARALERAAEGGAQTPLSTARKRELLRRHKKLRMSAEGEEVYRPPERVGPSPPGGPIDVNRPAGRYAEDLYTPRPVRRAGGAQPEFVAGGPMLPGQRPARTPRPRRGQPPPPPRHATRPDWRERRRARALGGRSKLVELKRNDLDRMEPRQCEAIARAHRDEMIRKTSNNPDLPVEVRYPFAPAPEVQARMADILMRPGSPIARVVFGDTVHDRPAPAGGG